MRGQLQQPVPDRGQRPGRGELRTDLRYGAGRPEPGGAVRGDRLHHVGVQHRFGGHLGALLVQEDVDLPLPGVGHVPTLGPAPGPAQGRRSLPGTRPVTFGSARWVRTRRSLEWTSVEECHGQPGGPPAGPRSGWTPGRVPAGPWPEQTTTTCG